MIEDETYTTRLDTSALARELTRFLRIELFYHGKLISITPNELPFQLGRDQGSCNMVLTGETISRQHGAFQLRDGQIGFFDTSTNGTYVRVGRAEDVFIRNEFFPLVGQGAIKLGGRIGPEDPETILYKVVSSTAAPKH